MWRETALVFGIGIALVVGYGLVNTARAEPPGEGDPAPSFRLQDQAGQWRTLADFQGKWVALYFYPKADTPGCTREACEFRDNVFAFEEIGATIVGVSLDDVKSQKNFADKYSLPFPLLADPSGQTAEAYGVMNNIMGMKLAKRQSFLIGPDGKIVKHYDNVDPKTHSKEVLSDIRQLKAADKGT